MLLPAGLPVLCEVNSVFKVPLIFESPFPFALPASQPSCLSPGSQCVSGVSEAPFCPSLPVPPSFWLSLFKCQLTFLACSVPICEPQTELLLEHLPFLEGRRIHLLRWSASQSPGCPALPHMLHSLLPPLLSMKSDSGMAQLSPFL